MAPKVNKQATNAQYFVPDVYVASLTKGKINTVTIEDLMILANTTGPYTFKDVLLCYATILIVLAWGAQVKLNSKLIVNRKANDSSPEKVFQQTDTHSKMTKILSQSLSAKLILSLNSIQKAINNDYYGYGEEEDTDEKVEEAIVRDLEDLMERKGPGTLQIHVMNAESRLLWLRASNSSLRSTWCAAPTYSPNKLASTSISLKTTKPEALLSFIRKVFDAVQNKCDVQDEEIPSEEEILFNLKETIKNLQMDDIIDDSPCGTVGAVPLETLLGFRRNAIVNANRTRKIPGLVTDLKSEFAQKPKSPKDKTPKATEEKENTKEPDA